MVTLCVHHTVFLEREREWLLGSETTRPFRRVAFDSCSNSGTRSRPFVHSFIRVHLHTRHSLTAGRHEQPPSFSQSQIMLRSESSCWADEVEAEEAETGAW